MYCAGKSGTGNGVRVDEEVGHDVDVSRWVFPDALGIRKCKRVFFVGRKMSVHLDVRNILTLCFLILPSTGPKGDFSTQIQGETE